MPRKKKDHSEHSASCCIACLQNCKTLRLIETQKDSLINLVTKHLHQDYQQDKEFLPKSICLNCIRKLEAHSSDSVYHPQVKYKDLVEYNQN